ncbi:MAG: SpoIIE family protein phosphatase, partial [candidate division Zixibacteria bacterium]|nr:SpoIIE family protein phosphatase [candidate division Zixibacteria bacterium]
FRLKNDTILIDVPIIEKSVVVGRMGIASSSQQIAEARNKSIVTVASITILMILIGIPLSMFLLHRKLKPISLITNGLKEIDFENIQFDIPFSSRNEFGYLSETLRVMGCKLNTAQKDIVEKERIARELEIAREIQAKILPHEFPKTATLEFYGTYQSAKEVGGDYYDFIDYDNDFMMFLVADVSGKSLPGMLVMLITRDIIRQLTRTVRQPDELLCEVNKELHKSIKKGMFVTMFLGLINKKTGEFTFASAGHNPLVILNAISGKSKLIKTNGFPLGMVPPEQFNKRIEKGQVNLVSGEWLVQYTDGINEAHNSENEEFGMDRFVANLESNIAETPNSLVDKFISKHQSFVGETEQFDDITLLAMKWFGENTDNNPIKEAEELNATRS